MLCAPAPAQSEPVADTVHASPEVLLVEDDGGVRCAIERMLRGSGYRVSTFDSAEALLERVHAQGLAGQGVCVVCDIRLPGASGVELHRRLTESGPLPPWIFITAHDDASVRALAAGLNAGYLPKPFEGRALLAMVAQALHA